MPSDRNRVRKLSKAEMLSPQTTPLVVSGGPGAHLSWLTYMYVYELSLLSGS